MKFIKENYENVPYGLVDVKKLLSGKHNEWWQAKEIEMDFGDGEKLAVYLAKKGLEVLYDEENETWYVPGEYSWTDAYFYPYEYSNQIIEENIDDDSPFTFTQIRDELKRATNNWETKEDTFRYYYLEEKDFAIKILSKHYECEYKGTDESGWHIIHFWKEDLTETFDDEDDIWNEEEYLEEEKDWFRVYVNFEDDCLSVDDISNWLPEDLRSGDFDNEKAAIEATDRIKDFIKNNPENEHFKDAINVHVVKIWTREDEEMESEVVYEAEVFNEDELTEENHLPDHFSILLDDTMKAEMADSRDEEEFVSDLITNKYGYTHNGFTYEIVGDELIISDVDWDIDQEDLTESVLMETGNDLTDEQKAYVEDMVAKDKEWYGFATYDSEDDFVEDVTIDFEEEEAINMYLYYKQLWEEDDQPIEEHVAIDTHDQLDSENINPVIEVKPVTESSSVKESFEDDWNKNIIAKATNRNSENTQKWNIGSNKLVNINSEEYKKLEELAKILTEKSPNGYMYTVERTYEDFGAGMEWYTIICYKKNGSSYQLLDSKQWIDLANGIYTPEEMYQNILENDEWFHDKLTEDIDTMNHRQILKYLDNLDN